MIGLRITACIYPVGLYLGFRIPGGNQEAYNQKREEESVWLWGYFQWDYFNGIQFQRQFKNLLQVNEIYLEPEKHMDMHDGNCMPVS